MSRKYFHLSVTRLNAVIIAFFLHSLLHPRALEHLLYFSLKYKIHNLFLDILGKLRTEYAMWKEASTTADGIRWLDKQQQICFRQKCCRILC